MPARLIDRNTPAVSHPAPFPGRPSPEGRGGHPPAPDPGYDALARLDLLRIALATAPVPPRPRGGEPPVWFFDRRRQADLEAARPAPAAHPFAELAARIAAELPALYASVEVRRVARAVDGLKAAAGALATACEAAKDLAELLAVPDDETVLVLHPDRRAGLRVVVRGVADVGQFHVLVADALPGGGMPGRFVAACRDANPISAGGVPMVADARFQLYGPAALTGEGTLPAGFGGCGRWLWPALPLAAVPKANGERVVLLGPPAFRATWEVGRRFPAMPAELRVLEVLGPAELSRELSRLTGRTVAAPRPVPSPELEVTRVA